METVVDGVFTKITNALIKVLDVVISILFGSLHARIITGLILFNGLGYYLIYIDKKIAIYNGEVKKANPNANEKELNKLLKRRVPERTLILTAMVFGSLGVLAGMHKFHHKTQKPLFKYGVPIIIAIQIILIIYTIIKRITM